MVEFALVFPFLMFLLMGVFDLGWAIYANNTVASAAREGARLAIITSNTDNAVRAQVRKAAQGLTLSDAQIVINPSPTRNPAGSVSVTVTYRYSPLTPFISNIIGGTYNVSSKATMIVE